MVVKDKYMMKIQILYGLDLRSSCSYLLKASGTHGPQQCSDYRHVD